MATGGRGHLGGARPEAALHPLEGDGVGRIRPRGEDRRAPGSRGAGRAVACDPRGDQGRAPLGLRRRPRIVRPVLRLGPPRREPADDPARRLPSPATAGRGHGRRHRARPAARRLRRALPGRPRQRRGGRPRRARGSSSRARSGWPRCSRSRDGSTTPSSSTSGFSRCGTTSACSRRSTTPSGSASWGTSRRRSRT